MRDWIKHCCEQEQLYPVEPLVPAEIIRHLFVSRCVYEMLPESKTDDQQTAEWHTMRAVMDTFTSGSLLSLPKDRKNKPNHHMAQLKPYEDGVWELRATVPKPGIRVLGLFAEKDIFIALDWDERLALGFFGAKPWRDIIVRTQTRWRNLFNNYEPLKGGEYDDYLTKYILN